MQEPATIHCDRQTLLKGLYLILDPSVRPDRPLTELLCEAAAQGVRLFQYRDKGATMQEAYRKATALRQAATQCGALLIVNDRCDLALAVEADGVHLGQDDLPIAYARRLMGPERLIGLSTHSIQQVRDAAGTGPDYIGFGPIFGTATKLDHDPVVGIEGLRSVRSLTELPIFAIGGITVASAPNIVAAGADGLAVISAVLKAPDVGAAVQAFQRALATQKRQSQ
ncbi:MAG: Thiamine-phosphate synthase [Nitrospirae bacterium]|nr:MAG: thiamine-phosphate pyrophosphorylase [Nitrospira sp. OLB3]MBV6469428.1 Thiamine-phosphate synthase [Nitrospirota bacterium]MEB2337677.1 thiamine phosphate synthase [Nitrospirales bacterium]